MNQPLFARNRSQGATSATHASRMVRVGSLVRGIRVPEALFVQRPDLAHENREEVTYICQVCGVVSPHEVQFGQPSQTGYLRRACACEMYAREEREVQRLVEERKAMAPSKTYTWLGVQQADLVTMTFEGFDAQYQLQAFQQARTYVKLLVSEGHTPPNLLLAGSYGTGKTHLACALLNELRSLGRSGLFTTAQDLFNALYAADFAKKQQLIDQVSTTPLLVLDDLDKLHLRADTDGAFQKRILFDILDRRYKCCLPTIITTNEQKDLGRWLDGATISRLFANILALSMNGQDYRRVKR